MSARVDLRALAAEYSNGRRLDTFNGDERAALRGLLLKSEAYLSPTHADHNIAVDNARALYEMDFPGSDEE